MSEETVERRGGSGGAGRFLGRRGAWVLAAALALVAYHLFAVSWARSDSALVLGESAARVSRQADATAAAVGEASGVLEKRMKDLDETRNEISALERQAGALEERLRRAESAADLIRELRREVGRAESLMDRLEERR